MNSSNTQQPEPGKELFENIFTRRKHEQSLLLISDGLVAVRDNAERLIGDIEVLIENERFASSSFLLTTANEEIAKFYILLDMCRLDPDKYEERLKKLCQSFYSHIVKYAYSRVVKDHDLFASMEHVKEMWTTFTRKWWPSNYMEDPDMPHDTYFIREMPLYVDYITYDRKWFIPQNTTRKEAFEEMFATDELSETKKLLLRLTKTIENNLHSPEYLKILNYHFRKKYISEKTKTDDLMRIYSSISVKLKSEYDIAEEQFEESALFEWPLYSLL